MGTHRIYVVVDPFNEVHEEAEENNAAWIDIQVPPKKDLEVTNQDATYAPIQPQEGEIVKNLDIDSAQNVEVKFYDGDPETNGILIGQDTIAQIDGSLARKAEINWNTDHQLGSHSIYIVVDEEDNIEETNNGNNLAVITIPINYTSNIIHGKDVFITGQDVITSPHHLTILDTLTVSAFVKNNGNQRADNVKVEFYDGNPNNGGIKIGDVLLQNIEARSMELAQITCNLQNEGIHNLYVVVDSENSVNEVYENNNMAFRSVNVSGDTDNIISVQSIDTSNYPKIVLKAQVSKFSGEPIFGLIDRNFSITEDSISAEIKLDGASSSEYGKPKIDIQFIVDTSGSMNDERSGLNSVLSTITQSISNQGIDLEYNIYNLGRNLTKGIYGGQEITACSEDWGPGTDWIAQNYSWREGADRIIIPISDENAHRGGSSSSQADINSVIEASNVAKENNVIVYPFYGNGSHRDVITNMERLANGTNGEVFYFNDTVGVTENLKNIITKAVSTYTMSYVTPNPIYDGTQRSVNLTLEYNEKTASANTSYWTPLDMRRDLVVDPNLDIEDISLDEGDSTTIKSTVKNIGGLPAEDIKVGFYQVNASGSEYRIGAIKTIEKLEPGNSIAIESNWTAKEGIEKIRCKVDPDSEMDEILEDNNQAEGKVYVYAIELPDLSISSLQMTYSPANPLVGDDVTIQAVIQNAALAARNIAVEFYAGNPDADGKIIGEPQIIEYMEADSQQTVSIRWDSSLVSEQDIYVLVDPADNIAEKAEANNKAMITVVFEEPNPDITVRTDKNSYNANEDMTIEIKTLNSGISFLDGAVLVEIIDEEENTVAQMDEVVITNLAPQETFIMELVWNTRVTLAGEYSIRVRFIRNGKTILTKTAELNIAPDKSIAIDFISNRAAYHAKENVNLSAEIMSQSKNYIYENISQEVTVFNESNEELFRDTIVIDQLLMGETRSNRWSWNTDVNKPGDYKARLVTKEDGIIIDEKEIYFEILSSLETGKALDGRILSLTDELIIGDRFELRYELRNIGNEDLDIPVEVMIVEPETATIKEAITNSVKLNIHAEVTGEISKDNLQVHTDKSYMVVLKAEVGGKEVILDSSHIEILPPKISFHSEIKYQPGILVWADDAINKALIAAALENRHCYYKIVSDNDSFIEELRTNRYKTYFILDPQHPFTGHQENELENKIYEGEGVFGTDEANKGTMRVNDLFGTDFKGYLPEEERKVTCDDSEMLDSGRTTFYGKFQKLIPTTAEVIAVTKDKGNEYPAILLNSYGNGQSVFLTFDPADTVAKHVYGDNETVVDSVYGQNAIALYEDGIDYLKPSEKEEFEQYDVLELTVDLHNSGPTIDTKFEIVLPEGITLVEAQEAIIEDNKLTWYIELDKDENKTLKYYIQITESLAEDLSIENRFYYLNVDYYQEIDNSTVIIPIKK